jgi:transcriptional regulator GlxA family with amidase domain
MKNKSQKKVSPARCKRVVEALTEIVLRPYTLKELGELYGMDYRTFKSWIAPLKEELGKKFGRYTINQVKFIFEEMGLPRNMKAD